MAIPLSYNIRNLRLRKGLTIMTALGIALTVTTAIFIMALLAGLKRAFVTSGDSQNVLVLRKGSEAELSGGFDAANFPVLKNLPTAMHEVAEAHDTLNRDVVDDCGGLGVLC